MTTYITKLPAPPNTSDALNFNSRADTFLASLPNFVTETNQVIGEINARTGESIVSSQLSASYAVSAASAVNATTWVSGTGYNLGQVVYDNVNFQTYRKKTATNASLATRPGLNPSDWVLLTGTIDFESKQDLSNKILISPKEKRVTLPNTSVTGSTTIDTNTGSIFTYTASSSSASLSPVVFVFSIPSVDYVPSDTVISFILEINKGIQSNSITFPVTVKWSYGVIPTLTANGIDVLGFYSYDRGSSWRGCVISRNIQ